MAIHTDLPIYRTGVRLLTLAIKAQEQMPRGVKRSMGDKISQHCVEMLDLMTTSNEHNNAPAVPQDILARACNLAGLPYEAFLKIKAYLPIPPAAPSQEPVTLTDEQKTWAVNQLMEQAQVFASAWSLVGGKFDFGDALEQAEQAKAELREMVIAALREKQGGV